MASTSEGGGGLKVEGGGGGGEASEAAAGGVVVRMACDEQQQQKSVVMVRELKKVKRERGGSTAKERISKMPPCTAGKRSSIYRGVTRHRWTGRYEAHLWDKSTWNQNQNKKGKQVYLGAYDDEEAAARAYDLAALKYWGPGTLINFPVTDYSRDLEEMQNVSREDYLASLRRKSSGFSRGLAKYRTLSRWEPSLGRTSGAEYVSQYGDDAAAESGYLSGFCLERKIDLTGYIKWWGTDKTHQVDMASKSTKHGSAEDIAGELKSLEWAVLSTEPYQMPRLGTSHEEKKTGKGSSVSAMSILSRSAAYKNMQEKVSKAKEMAIDNDENENKSNINKINCGKAVEKSMSLEGGLERLGAAAFEMGALLPHKTVFPLSPLLSAPLLTNYSTIDPLADPLLWSSLSPVLPTGPSQTTEVTKSETASAYTHFRQEER
ncbi:hypothetical protein Ancab_013829 [Ancistrocladus abbreviatus]